MLHFAGRYVIIMTRNSGGNEKKEVKKMGILAEPVKAAFEVNPEKAKDFRKKIGSDKISEIQNQAKKITNITFKDSSNAKR